MTDTRVHLEKVSAPRGSSLLWPRSFARRAFIPRARLPRANHTDRSDWIDSSCNGRILEDDEIVSKRITRSGQVQLIAPFVLLEA